MKHIKFGPAFFRRLGQLPLTLVLLSLGLASPALSQEITGYISPNENDLPPSMERDDSLRSTDPDRPPAYGPTDAKVIVVMFADFECPACRRASQAIHRIAYEFPGEVRIEFWNRPLAIHKTAHLAAAAGIAAQRQGKFWEMHDLLYQNSRHDQATLEQHAQALGLDLDQFRADLSDPTVQERIESESELAVSLGAVRTPGYLFNGDVREGWGSWKGFVFQVKRELDAANTLAEQGLSPHEIQVERALTNNDNSEIYELYRTRILDPNLPE